MKKEQNKIKETIKNMKKRNWNGNIFGDNVWKCAKIMCEKYIM